MDALGAVNKKTISLLTTYVKSRKLIGVSRETIRKVIKNWKIRPKVLVRKSNALCDILLTTEQEAKQLAGSILTAKWVHFQTEYMRTRKTKVTIQEAPVDISKDLMGMFFAQYGRRRDLCHN